jgi:two-component system sensor histidine kinase HydH
VSNSVLPARWSLLAVALLTGVALVGVNLSAWWGNRALVDAVTQGQAMALSTSLHEGLLEASHPPRADEVEALLAQGKEFGLRGVAFYTPHGDLLTRAGEGVDAPPDAEALKLHVVGDLVRMTLNMEGPGGPSPGREPSGDGERGKAPPKRPPVLVIAFAPLHSRALQSRASRTLAAGLVAALLSVIAALFAARAQARAEAAEARLHEQRRLAALGEMSAVLAHEIRNPLASLKGHAQLLAELLPAGRTQDKAERVVSEAVRLETLSDQLLDFVRSDQVAPVEADPGALLAECAESLGDSRIEVQRAGAPARGALVPLRMRQVLLNLLDNALKASPEAAVVDARVTREGERLLFTVRDRGAGLAPGAEARIFEPFHTGRVRGVGLGLAVARRIVSLHAGTISAGNHPEGGAVFRVALPPGGR